MQIERQGRLAENVRFDWPDNRKVIGARDVESEANRFVLGVNIGPTNTAEHNARLQPFQRQGRAVERLDDSLKAQATRGNEEDRALGLPGNIADDAFDLHPL